MMDPSREYQQQAIDVEIKSIQESIRTLKTRRNALAPISSLPTGVIADIFFILQLPGTSPLGASGEPDLDLAWLRVVHVCHHWREIALNQPLLWSHVNFFKLTSAGAAEMLARAKEVPLHLEARVTSRHWDNSRFRAFEKELQLHVSHIYHLTISTDDSYLCRTLQRLTSPAPTLEYLSLSHRVPCFPVSVPDRLFDGTAPRLSFLKLQNCGVNWKSPLLKGLRCLELHTPSEDTRPSLADWLDALDEMPQLKKLALHSASPIAPPFPFDVGRTVTLPFLTHLDISPSPGDCALALAHLVLPTLTWLCLTAVSENSTGDDVLAFLPYVTGHTHGPQDSQPLQSALIYSDSDGTGTHILAWPVPNVVVNDRVPDPVSLLTATLAARVVLSIRTTTTCTGIVDAAIAALSLDSIVTLTVQHRIWSDERFWIHHAPRWSLLQRLHLAPHAARGFGKMLDLQDNDGSECPLLPSLTRLDLIDNAALRSRKALRLCDALMNRVELGVPLETLDLRTCYASRHAVRLLSEIVVDVWGPFAPDNSSENDDNGSHPYANDNGEEGDDDGEEWDEVIDDSEENSAEED